MTRSRPGRRVRPSLDLLEDRRAPAVGLLSAAAPLVSAVTAPVASVVGQAATPVAAAASDLTAPVTGDAVALPPLPLVGSLTSAVAPVLDAVTAPLAAALPDIDLGVSLDLSGLPLPLDLGVDLGVQLGGAGGLVGLDAGVSAGVLGLPVGLDLGVSAAGTDGLVSLGVGADVLGLAVTAAASVAPAAGPLLGVSAAAGPAGQPGLGLTAGVGGSDATVSVGLGVPTPGGSVTLPPVGGGVTLPGGVVPPVPFVVGPAGSTHTPEGTPLPGVVSPAPGGTAALIDTPPATAVTVASLAAGDGLAADEGFVADQLVRRASADEAALGLTVELTDGDLFDLGEDDEAVIDPAFAAVALTAIAFPDGADVLVAPPADAPSGPGGNGTPADDARGGASAGAAADGRAAALSSGFSVADLVEPGLAGLAELEAALGGLVRRVAELMPGGPDTFARMMPVLVAALAALAAVRAYRRRHARRTADPAAGLPPSAGLAPGVV